jgi:enamine deaminase RidA (YjgF/YER057c/UK114 family)
MRTALNPPGVFPPRGNYVHAVVVSAPTLVFVAGQTALDADGNVVGKGDIEAQTRQVFRNLELILEAAGSSLQDVVTWTIYDTDPDAHREAISRVSKELMGGVYPASSRIGVTRLANPDYLLEIDAVAIVRDTSKDV